MSEQPKSPEKISRRDFLRAAVVGGASLGGAIYAGAKALEGLGVRFFPYEPPAQNFFYEESKVLARATREVPTPAATAEPSTPVPGETVAPEPSPTPEMEGPFTFAKIDFSDSPKMVSMGFFIGGETTIVPPFIPFAFYEGALQDGVFASESNTGLAYLETYNRIILNIHSGRRGPLDTRGFSAYALQLFLETNPETGNRRYPREADQYLTNTVVGSEVVLKQKDQASLTTIAAAVRVPPQHVWESQRHVADITDWLTKKYPESTFKNLEGDEKYLVIKFCGRILGGEDEDPRRSPSQQSRFFLALKEG